MCSYYLDRALPLSIVQTDRLMLNSVVIAVRMILILKLLLYTDLYCFILSKFVP